MRIGAAVALALFVAVAAGACVYRRGNPPLTAPAQAVENVLVLRRERSKDASAYAQYFEEVGIAQLLAEEAGVSTEASATEGSPIPDWERLSVSAQTTSTADVVVRWRRNAKFEAWAAETTFKTKLRDGRWVIIDAVDTDTTESDTRRSNDSSAPKPP